MNYKYRARDRYGKPASGSINGDNKNSVAKHLTSMGYVPISIEEQKDLDIANIFIGFRKVTLEELNTFTRQLLTLQKAGIPLLVSLGVLEKQVVNKYFRDVIKEMSALVEGGTSLSESMGRYPNIFSELYVNMVRAGEVSGLLDEVLARLAEFGEKELETRARVKTAMRYPMITLGALFGAFVIITTFVIPKFATIFSQFKTELPLPTRILLDLSYAMRNYWYLMFASFALAAYLVTKYIRSKKGRARLDAFMLKMPVFGPIVSMFAMSRFSRTMSILIRSGLPILQVLDMTARTVGNSVVAETIGRVAVNVREGKGMSEPMRSSGIFPPMVIQMVAIGEDTGKVDELLMKVSEYYDQQTDYAIKNLSTLIEPIFILILGAMVLVMALAIFLPMWNLITLFKH